MVNIDKKVNKLKKFVSDHKEEITIIGYGLCSYAIGVGIGYICGVPTKRTREFFKKGTRGVYGFDCPEDMVITVRDIFTDNFEYLHEAGIEPDDRIVSYLVSIAKSET